MEGHEAPKESRCSRLVVMNVLVVVVDGAWLWRDNQGYRPTSHPDPRKILLTGFQTDDVQTLERIMVDQNDDERTESLAMINSPRATATTTPIMATNDHRHDWVTKTAADVVVLHLPIAFILREMVMMVMMIPMRTGS